MSSYGFLRLGTIVCLRVFCSCRRVNTAASGTV
jgi:hypothetical protein